jgi:septation ring formation regulator EzrA
MTFSSGDWVAIAFGSIALVRWLFEKYLDKSETEEEKVATLRLDYEKYISGAAERERSLFESVKRIERSVSNLQSQLRLYVSGGSNKSLEIRDITEQ